MTRRDSREEVHVTYRGSDGNEYQALVTETQRDALHRAGALTRDRGESRLLASMDRWGDLGGPDRLKAYPPDGTR